MTNICIYLSCLEQSMITTKNMQTQEIPNYYDKYDNAWNAIPIDIIIISAKIVESCGDDRTFFSTISFTCRSLLPYFMADHRFLMMGR